MRRLREQRLVFQLAFPVLATGLAPVQRDTASYLSSSPPHEQLLLLDSERCPACDLPLLAATCQCRSCPLCAEDCDTHTLTPLVSVPCSPQAHLPNAQGDGHASVVGSATRATPNTITSALQSLACDMWTTTLSGLVGGALANVATLARYMPRAAPPRARAPRSTMHLASLRESFFEDTAASQPCPCPCPRPPPPAATMALPRPDDAGTPQSARQRVVDLVASSCVGPVTHVTPNAGVSRPSSAQRLPTRPDGGVDSRQMAAVPTAPRAPLDHVPWHGHEFGAKLGITGTLRDGPTVLAKCHFSADDAETADKPVCYTCLRKTARMVWDVHLCDTCADAADLMTRSDTCGRIDPLSRPMLVDADVLTWRSNVILDAVDTIRGVTNAKDSADSPANRSIFDAATRIRGAAKATWSETHPHAVALVQRPKLEDPALPAICESQPRYDSCTPKPRRWLSALYALAQDFLEEPQPVDADGWMVLPPSPRTWRQVRRLQCLRRTEEQEARYNSRRQKDRERSREASRYLPKQFVRARSWRRMGFILVLNPFPYDVQPAALHLVLFAHAEHGWDALGDGPSWDGAWKALHAMGVARSDDVVLHVNDPKWRSISALPHAHVFVRVSSTAADAALAALGQMPDGSPSPDAQQSWCKQDRLYASSSSSAHKWHSKEQRLRWRAKRRRKANKRIAFRIRSSKRPANVHKAFPPQPDYLERWDRPVAAVPAPLWDHTLDEFVAAGGVNHTRLVIGLQDERAYVGFKPPLSAGLTRDVANADIAEALRPGPWDTGAIQPQHVHSIGKITDTCPACRWVLAAQLHCQAVNDMAAAAKAERQSTLTGSPARPAPEGLAASTTRADRGSVHFSHRNSVKIPSTWEGQLRPADWLTPSAHLPRNVNMVLRPTSPAVAARWAATAAAWAARRAKCSRKRVVHVKKAAMAYRSRNNSGAAPASEASRVAFDAHVVALQALITARRCRQRCRSWALVAASGVQWQAKGGPAPLPLALTLAVRAAKTAAMHALASCADTIASACAASGAAMEAASRSQDTLAASLSNLTLQSSPITPIGHAGTGVNAVSAAQPAKPRQSKQAVPSPGRSWQFVRTRTTCHVPSPSAAASPTLAVTAADGSVTITGACTPSRPAVSTNAAATLDQPANAPPSAEYATEPAGLQEQVPPPRLRGSTHHGSSHKRSLAYVGRSSVEQVPPPPPECTSCHIELTVQSLPAGTFASLADARAGIVQNHTVDTTADSGAFSTFFAKKFIDSLPASAIVRILQPAKYMRGATVANGASLVARAFICVRFCHGDKTFYLWGHVVDDLASPMLLGMDNLLELGATISCPDRVIRLNTIDACIKMTPCAAHAVQSVESDACNAPKPGDVYMVVTAEDHDRVLPSLHETSIQCLVVDSRGQPLSRNVSGYIKPTMRRMRVSADVASKHISTAHDDANLPKHVLPGTTQVIHTPRVVAGQGTTTTFGANDPMFESLQHARRGEPMSLTSEQAPPIGSLFIPVANLSLRGQRIRRGGVVATITIMDPDDISTTKSFDGATRGTRPAPARNGRPPARQRVVGEVTKSIRQYLAQASPTPDAKHWAHSSGAKRPAKIDPDLPPDYNATPEILRAQDRLHNLLMDLSIFDEKCCKGNRAHQDQLAGLVWEFRDIFATDPRVVLANSGVQHSIPTGDARPIKLRRYRRSPHERKIIDKAVAKMLRDDVIRKCSSPWAAQVVLTRKPDGSWRFCTDYSKLAKVTVKDCYPLPRVETVINATADSTYLSTHDLSSGYWQVAMSKRDGSHLKTAFVTERGQYCYNVMPFGLTNASATMQRMVDDALAPILWKSCAAYIDDCVVYTKGSFKAHLQALRDFYTLVRKAGLHIKPTKCFLARERVELLGHVVDGNTRSPTDENMAAVKDYARPTTRKKLRSFMGLASYFREYASYFSDVAAPLYELLNSSKRVANAWNKHHEHSFQNIKRVLTSRPLLRLPRYGPKDGQFEVQTDASGCGLGAVLLQYPSRADGTKGTPFPVAYRSRGMTKTERGYDTPKRETLALVWAMKKFNAYVGGTDVRIRTDHKNLEWLLTADHADSMYQSWRATLAPYRFELRYDTDVAVADALSRDQRWDQVEYKVTLRDFWEGLDGTPTTPRPSNSCVLQHQHCIINAVIKGPPKRTQLDADAGHAQIKQAIQHIHAEACEMRSKLLQTGGKQLKREHAAAVATFLDQLHVTTDAAYAALAELRRFTGQGRTAKRRRRQAQHHAANIITRSMSPRGGRPPTAIDLFCGGGGFSLGAANAGFDVRLGLDTNPQARAVFARLHDAALCLGVDCGNVMAVRDAVTLAMGSSELAPDVVFASPPCTPFSTATPSDSCKQRQLAKLLIATAANIINIGPKAAVIENVPRANLSAEWHTMRHMLMDAGYMLEEGVIDAAKCGVPQRRRRRFIIATKGCGPAFLQAASERIQQATDTPVAAVLPDSKVYWHYGRYPKDSCLRDPAKPSPTLRSNCGYFPQSGTYQTRPSDGDRSLADARRLTVEELASIQGWPRHSHGALPKSRITACEILGRSVAPPVATIVANLTRTALGSTRRQTSPAPSAKRHVVSSVERLVAGLEADQSISIQQTNPKQRGSKSFLRYERYKSATTRAQFLAQGGTRADYTHDLRKGFITLRDTPSTPSEDQHTSTPADTMAGQDAWLTDLVGSSTDNATRPDSWFQWRGQDSDDGRRPDNTATGPPRYPGLAGALPGGIDIIRAQRDDQWFGSILATIEGNIDAIPPHLAMSAKRAAPHFVLHDDVLYHVDGLSTPGKVVRHQLCIPSSLRERITEEAHALGHVGITKLLGVLRRRFYWPHMSKTVKTVVRRCGPCAEHKARRFRKLCLRKPMVSDRPWYHVHIDLWQPGTVSAEGHKYVLTVIDRLTHWPEMIPIHNKEAKTVARAFFESVICRHGVPPVVISDNGSEFKDVFDELVRKYGVRQIKTTPHHPQANGIVERLHGFMRGSIAAMSTEDRAQWHRLLPVTAFAYRSAPVANTGHTPFFLMHGREPVLPGELVAPPLSLHPVAPHELVERTRTRLEHAFQSIRELEWEEKTARLHAAPLIPSVQFAVGDRVLFERDRIAGDVRKLAPRATPHVVVRASHPHYVVKSATGRHLRALAQHLRQNFSAPVTYTPRVPSEPDAASTRLEVDDAPPLADSLVILRSESASEPWRLALVIPEDPDDPTPAGHVRIHYYNRANKSASPDKWAWRPAYVDPKDGVDVLTYSPARRYQPYHRVVPQHMLLFNDVRLTRSDRICVADLQRVSASDDVAWTFRPVLAPADVPSTVTLTQPTLTLSPRQLREARRRRPKASTSEQRRERAQEKRAAANSARAHRRARRSR